MSRARARLPTLSCFITRNRHVIDLARSSLLRDRRQERSRAYICLGAPEAILFLRYERPCGLIRDRSCVQAWINDASRGPRGSLMTATLPLSTSPTGNGKTPTVLSCSWAAIFAGSLFVSRRRGALGVCHATLDCYCPSSHPREYPYKLRSGHGDGEGPRGETRHPRDDRI